MRKEHKYFNHAFENWTGKKWEWKNEVGEKQHPLDSTDPEIVAFYKGFYLAKKGQADIMRDLSKLNNIKRQIKELEKNIERNYKREI